MVTPAAPPGPDAFERFAAERLLEQRLQLCASWMDAAACELGPLPLPDPSASVEGLADVLRQVAEALVEGPEPELPGEPLLLAPVRELGRVRQAQGRSPDELLHEFSLLARLLDEACLAWIRAHPAPPPLALARVVGRLNRAVLRLAEIAAAGWREQDALQRAELETQMREFADVLAHELKNPLGAAEGAAQLLLEDEGAVGTFLERRRFAALIQRNLRRARMVLGSVRGLALARSRRARAERSLAMRQVLAEVLEEMAPVLRDTAVQVDVSGPVPDVRVDAARVETVLLNLIANAAKYSDPDRPTRWLRVSFERRRSGWWVCVSDNGLGIPAEDQSRIFQRFFRAHPGRAEGSGLGLSIVAEAVRQMGSTIEFESHPGIGSTFRFALPAEAEGEGERAREATGGN